MFHIDHYSYTQDQCHCIDVTETIMQTGSMMTDMGPSCDTHVFLLFLNIL